MISTALGGTPVPLAGDLPPVGSPAPDFTLTAPDLSDLGRDPARRTVLNIFPSIDTGVCAASVREFNQRAATLPDTDVVNVSADLPFAMSRFCGAEGIDNAKVGSAFRSTFGADYGVTLVEGAFAGLLARAVVVIDRDGSVLHSQLVPEIAQEPDYDAAVASLV
ncbi:MAG: tpx [Aeromicrobium sp.]|nr:tpx [Aeromicrobium sp.]